MVVFSAGKLVTFFLGFVWEIKVLKSSLGPEVGEWYLLSWKCEFCRFVAFSNCSVGFSALFYFH